MDVHSGDTVRLSDSRVGRVCGYRLHVGAGEESQEYKVRFEGGATEHVLKHRIVELVRVGPHDYQKGAERGICGRCGTRKRDHGTVSTARGMEGQWATPNGGGSST